MSELCDLSLETVAELIRGRQVSPVEVTESVLRRIDERDGELNAFVTVLADRALEQATRAEVEILAGTYRGPLHGVPVSVKDIFDTAGIRTTAASRILANHVPERNAAVIDRMEAAGAILIGKNNLLEFAYGTAHPDCGPSLNPWNTAFSSGGSSSGSAVAVAAGMGFGSIGTDTGGSIRIPASFCGVVGLKPTFDRIDRTGLIPLSVSMDHIGPIARTARDAGLLFDAIADPEARRAVDGPGPTDLCGVRLGVDRAYHEPDADPEVLACFEAALVVLRDLGAELVEVRMPPFEEVLRAVFTVRGPEGSHAHAAWRDAYADDYSPAVLGRIRAGLQISAADYLAAKDEQRRLTVEMTRMFNGVDALVMPTLSFAAMSREEDPTLGAGSTAKTAGFIRMTSPFNLTGHPAVTIPCGFTSNRLPIGLQLAGPYAAERELIRFAHAYERAHSGMAQSASSHAS
jgi:aspartyl-tRNA(Asn)/glutamyl-tRNA(Gln) amidotransferase subunit A